MADLSEITLPSGSIYKLKDAKAREDIEAIEASIAGGLSFIGETTTPLTDGATTNPIVINGTSQTALSGNLVLYGSKEFLFDGTKWIEMGDLSLLGALAYKSSASGSFTPSGTVSQPTFTGSSSQVDIVAEDDANGNYQPKGTVSAPVISLDQAGSTAVVNSITAVGSLPALSMTVANENLTFSWDPGSLPTKGANTTVKTGDATYQASQPIFTGTKAEISGDVTPLGTVSQPAFTGTQGTVNVS